MVNFESKRQYENELLVLKEIKKLHNSRGKLNIYFTKKDFHDFSRMAISKTNY